MAVSADILAAMAMAGCTADQIVAVVRADEHANAERIAHRREKNRIYQQNHRARKQSKRLHADVSADTSDLLSPVGPSPRPLSPNPQSSIPPSPPKGGSSPTTKTEFDGEFWPRYPNKVGKPDAERAFAKARQRASLGAILAGLEAYRSKTDDRPWCNPSTWLNQDRWNDQHAVVPRGQGPPQRNGMLAAAERYLQREIEREQDHDGPTIETSDFKRNHDGAGQAVLSFAPSKPDQR